MKFDTYKDDKGEWRWRLKAINGKILADPSEGYSTKQACQDGIDLVRSTTASTLVEEDD
jgi:uncharacterized protein YegP (UPF0339 family)